MGMSERFSDACMCRDACVYGNACMYPTDVCMYERVRECVCILILHVSVCLPQRRLCMHVCASIYVFCVSGILPSRPSRLSLVQDNDMADFFHSTYTNKLLNAHLQPPAWYLAFSSSRRITVPM